MCRAVWHFQGRLIHTACLAEATDDGRVVVATGGASGIGHACVRRFAAAGDQVIVVDVNAIAGETVAAEIVEAGGNASFEPLDVTDRVAVVTLAARIDAAYGPAGVLINSAGILQKLERLADFPDEINDQVWAVNYFGTYNCCKHFGLRMADRGAGAIINIASLSSYRTMPLLAYGPSKTAIVSLTGTLAVELGVKGVRVNAVAPGMVLTPAQEKNFQQGLRGRRSDPAHRLRLAGLGMLAHYGRYSASGLTRLKP